MTIKLYCMGESGNAYKAALALELSGLDWEPGVLDFHKNKRAVNTVSAMQVRQKIYKGSSEAWKPFAPFVPELFDSLPES